MGHPEYHEQITRSWICVFTGHLPDSILLPLELVSYLKVICAQSWEHVEAFLDLRSPKISPHWLHPWSLILSITLYILLYFLSSSDPWSNCVWFPFLIFVSGCGVDIFQCATEIWEIFLRLQNVLKRDQSCYIYCCNDNIRAMNNKVIMIK